MQLKDKIRKQLFAHMDQTQIDDFYKIYYRLRYPDEMEKRKSYGDLNKDKTVYIIRPRKDCTEGLMSLFINVMWNIYYADQHQYVSVVDFKNYKTQYYDASNPDFNVWNLYFTQPSNISLNDAYQSKDVILSGLNIQYYRPKELNMTFDKENLEYLHNFLFSKIDFSEVTKKKVRDEEFILNLDYANTLGLYLRGTDYTSLKPSGHPVQPTLNQAFEKVDEVLTQNNEIHSIFLVTEDEKIFEAVNKKYANMCKTVSFDQYIKDYTGDKLLAHDQSIYELDASPYVRGMNYLVKLIILSKCNYLIAGKTNGSWASCIFSGGSNYQYIFNLGKYGK